MRPIVTWRRYIIAGHGVVIARAVARLDGDRRRDASRRLPEHLALAYLAADNELARMGDPDQAALAAILEDSRAVDAELLQAIGYDDRELSELLAQIDRRNADDAQNRRETRSRPTGRGMADGSRPAVATRPAPDHLWRQHRPGDLGAVDGWKAADLVWTDPPYGVDYAGSTAKNR